MLVRENFTRSHIISVASTWESRLQQSSTRASGDSRICRARPWHPHQRQFGRALASDRLNGSYRGTKGHLLKLSLRLQQEVAGNGVRVQVVLPSATRTAIWERPARTSRLCHQTS